MLGCLFDLGSILGSGGPQCRADLEFRDRYYPLVCLLLNHGNGTGTDRLLVLMHGDERGLLNLVLHNCPGCLASAHGDGTGTDSLLVSAHGDKKGLWDQALYFSGDRIRIGTSAFSASADDPGGRV